MIFTALGFCIASFVLLQIEDCRASIAHHGTDERIVGGMAINISNVPYVVQVWVNSSMTCGGTLIDPSYVVTAGHCFRPRTLPEFVTVVGGASLLNETGVRRKAEKLFKVSNFNVANMNNDVAVLKLKEPLTGSTIKPIPLCSSQPKAGAMMRVSGWGLLNQTSYFISNQLMTIEVPITNRAKCVSQYQGVIPISNTMICASQPGIKDSCMGDSGGPGVVNGQLCGIVSFGAGCASKRYPGIYTNIMAVKKFIENRIKLN